MPADVNAEDMQALLQTNFPGMGVINIDLTGDCAGRKWSVTWLTVPGELPLIEVSDLTVCLCCIILSVLSWCGFFPELVEFQNI